MRPRFSLRTLLVLTALAAAACWWWVARPTIVAERFAAAVNRGTYAAAGELFCEPTSLELGQYASPESRFLLSAKLHPRTTQDLLRGRWRLVLRADAKEVAEVPDFDRSCELIAHRKGVSIGDELSALFFLITTTVRIDSQFERELQFPKVHHSR
jgi:hypothetical protein